MGKVPVIKIGEATCIRIKHVVSHIINFRIICTVESLADNLKYKGNTKLFKCTNI